MPSPSGTEKYDTYKIKGKQLRTILELCVGTQSQVGERYKKHKDLALAELADAIEGIVHETYTHGFPPPMEIDIANDRFKDRVKNIVAKEKGEERAMRDIKAAKDTFGEIRDIMKQAEEAMGQSQDAASAWKSLEQVKQFIGVKRKAEEDDNKDESDDLSDMDQLPAPKRRR